MKLNQKRTTQILTVIFTITVLFTLASSSANAQKAPPFSNDIMMDNQTYVFFRADRLEYNVNSGLNPLVLDAEGYIGKDLNKFWFQADGDALTTQKEGEIELQALYSRAISSYFDIQTGIRYDVAYSRVNTQSRGFAVVGLQGLAPYLFELDTNLFISQDGDVSADFEAEYDFPLTQRLWGQPRFETSVAAQDVERFGVGLGFNNVQLGFRLRYEIEREFAPYIGVSWNRKLGQTADFTRDEGGNANVFGLVGGVRMWF